jgi:dipeptidyl aminopeptidase/acylaminoacyl peptidase
MPHRSLGRLAVLAASLAAASAFAQPSADAAQSGYNVPPRNILDVMVAQSPPTPIVSPTHDNMLLVSLEDYPSIKRVATPYLKLAGVRVEIRNHSKHDTPGGYGITPCARAIDVVHLAEPTSQVRIDLRNVCVTHPRWSADGAHFVFENIAEDSVQLWVADRDGHPHLVHGVRLNPILGSEVEWMPDQKSVLVKLVPDGMGPMPAKSEAPIGPSIQESVGQKGESSTYETRDTLGSRYDEDLFDYFVTSQLAIVDIATGRVTPIGKPDRYEAVDASPDGKYLLVKTLHKPYSYVTTYERFPAEVDVWDISSQPVRQAYHVASLPLADRVPIHGVRLGPRDYAWRATDPATLVWAEALDQGDWKVKVPHRDSVRLVRAPFTSPPVEITRTQQRYQGIEWGERPDTAILYEFDLDRHWRRAFLMDVDHPEKTHSLLWDFSSDEKYANPGRPVERVLPNGQPVIQQNGDAIYLHGLGSSPDGDRPFLDRLDLTTRKTERLFRSDKHAYEYFLAFSPNGTRSIVTWHQSSKDPPNAYIRTIGARVDLVPGEAAYASQPVAVTHLEDPTPIVRQIKKRLVTYKRADGVDLSFTLYTPPGYTEGTRVPTILYAYPLDYADASKAGQVSGSQELFTRLRQYQLMLLAGYAIIDRASFPVVGDPRKAYDTYLEQLVADAKAAVAEAVRLGVADPDRIGVTGHSHGALMTVNLVAHSDLFRAGVATSGSYNKTLTPFGFQNERRSVWEAPDVYFKVSPFFVAEKVKTPLLIVHGMDDANPGTTPLQGVKLYEAVRGNGGTTRLVMLPNEPHWYTALESNEQLVYEMLNWFDKYVKNAPPRAPARTAAQ